MTIHRPGSAEPLSIRFARTDAFRGNVWFRDPRALSPHPSLVLRGPAADQRLVARGGFVIRHEYWISQENGCRFVDATGDENGIHRTGDVVAGAMTTSKLLLPVEVLMPEVRVLDVSVKFTDKAVYGERTLNVFTVSFTGEKGVAADVRTYQSQRLVAKARIEAQSGVVAAHTEIRERNVNREQYERVREFFASLQIDSEAYFDRGGLRNYTYPLSFLASLPSGAIVKHLQGDGGMLNSLRLDFRDMPRIPIVGKGGPTVKVEQPRRRKTFNRIFTEIVNDLVTYCRGSAIVNPVASFAETV